MSRVPNNAELLLDFDGTIADTNNLKKNAIAEAANLYSKKESYNASFVNYFVENNGLTREFKISQFFPCEKQARNICDAYELILQRALLNCTLTQGCEQFLIRMKNQGCSISIISGGVYDEITAILDRTRIRHLFKDILAAPLEKKQHLNRMSLSENVILIGDSKVDYDAAISADIDFIFMYGYTQFDDWRRYFADKNIPVIKDLTEIG